MRWLILSWATLSVVLSGVAGGAHRGAGAQEPVGTRSDRRVQPTPALLTTHMTAASPRPEGASAACSMPSTVPYFVCLLYTSDAADDLLCVDLGGRRII